MLAAVLAIFSLWVVSVATLLSLIFSPFGPVFDHTIDRRAFRTGDLLATFIPLALGFASAHWWLGGAIADPASVALAVLGVAFLVAFSTFYSMQLLWRMNLSRWWKRTMLISFLMPAGILISFFAFFFIVAQAESGPRFTMRFVGVVSTVLLLRSTSMYLYCNQDHAGHNTHGFVDTRG